MLKQKARNSWIADGDSNTKYFHSTIRIRRSSNAISELVDDAGNSITEHDQLRDHIVSYYEAKFNGDHSVIDEHLFEIEHEVISADESAAMDAIPNTEEIKHAVFDLGADSCPGPDGFSGCFYRHCWEVIQ